MNYTHNHKYELLYGCETNKYKRILTIDIHSVSLHNNNNNNNNM